MVNVAHSSVTETARGESSAPGLGLRQVTFQAMGTRCEIQYGCEDAVAAKAFELTAVNWVKAFEARYSRFIESSLVSRINTAAGQDWVEIDPEMEEMLKLCDTLHHITRGILEPTLLPLIRLWDYKAANPVIPSAEQIDHARRLVGWSKVQRAPGAVFLPQKGMALDFGGFGKEYAVDVVAQIAIQQGIASVLVDFGHDLRSHGKPPDRPAWQIGLEDPKHPGTYGGSVAFTTSRGIASSGDYLRQFVKNGRRYGHIIDPRTGYPVANGCLQATVIAKSCLHAGVLSTTAFILGVPAGIDFIQSFPGAEGLIITENARAQTRGFFNHVVPA